MLVVGGLLAPAFAAEAPVPPVVLDDPMLPPGEEPKSADANTGSGARRPARETFHLSAIRVDRNQPNSAIINGKRVKVGSRIGSAEVTAIMPNSVTLKQQGRSITVRLLPIEIKKKPGADKP